MSRSKCDNARLRCTDWYGTSASSETSEGFQGCSLSTVRKHYSNQCLEADVRSYPVPRWSVDPISLMIFHPAAILPSHGVQLHHSGSLSTTVDECIEMLEEPFVIQLPTDEKSIARTRTRGMTQQFASLGSRRSIIWD